MVHESTLPGSGDHDGSSGVHYDLTKVIAFGLGETAIDKSIGKFKVKLQSADGEDQNIEIQPCIEDIFCAKVFSSHQPSSLFFAQNSSLNASLGDQLLIEFEICSGESYCLEANEISQ